jgi:hypothetical protein
VNNVIGKRVIMAAIWVILCLLALLSILGMSIASSSSEIRGIFLADRFAKLGTLSGKTKAEILSVVGEPTHIDYHMPGGRVLLQWIFPKYHIALLFDGEICEGITHEAVSK